MAEGKSTQTTQGKERDKASLPSLEDAIAWDGKQIDGLGNKSLGRVAGIHVDANDGEPRWVLIRLGPIAGCTAIPFEHVAEGAGRLWAAYERDWIREAPRFRSERVADRAAGARALRALGHPRGAGQGGRGRRAGRGRDHDCPR